MTDAAQAYFPYFFPPFFIAMWMVVTTMLGAMSGWFTLQREFPNSDGASRLTLRMRSGRMGLGVNMSGILTLAACPSGLRIGILRLFGPFQRPFLVPWDRITAEPRTQFFIPSVRLSFGRPEVGTLTIDARLWQRLAAEASAPNLRLETPPVSVRNSGYGMLMVWLAITAIAATFFYLTSRASGAQGIPIAVCIGLPGIFFGTVTLVRFLRQVR